MKIFKVHPENMFGVKRLTDADLGQNVGHQTHIGLYQDILTYLQNEDEIKESYLIFGNKCERLDCFFDRIKNPDGTFRSPKIRTGETDSIVRRIREYAVHSNRPLYLMWFGLDNKELIFILFEEGSRDYDFFKHLDALGGTFPFSDDILKYVFSRFDQTNENIMVDLELCSQGILGKKHYRRIDIERANELFKQTGKCGEELVCKYLENLKQSSTILDFMWLNKSRESGLPYDFQILQNNRQERFVDVKTTRFRFEAPIIFSAQEMIFISNEPVLYSIFRTYDIVNNKPKLRICDNSKDKMSIINTDFIQYVDTCKEHGYQTQSSFIVSPSDPMLQFSKDIIL